MGDVVQEIVDDVPVERAMAEPVGIWDVLAIARTGARVWRPDRKAIAREAGDDRRALLSKH